MPETLRRLQANYKALERFVRDRGLDPGHVRRVHGRLNLRDVCKRFDVEKAYLVDYALGSAYVHEKNAASSNYVIDKNEQRQFHLGPIGTPGGPATIAIDVLIDMVRVLTIATRIVEDEKIITRADEVLKKIVGLRDQYSSRPIWPSLG